MKYLLLVGTLCMITGCSHNAITYSDGVGLETTIRPDTGTLGLNFRYGKILTAVMRENSEVDMQGAGNGGANNTTASTASANGSVKVKIGKQITGYYVDAIKAGATTKQLDAYIGDSKTVNTNSETETTSSK